MIILYDKVMRVELQFTRPIAMEFIRIYPGRFDVVEGDNIPICPATGIFLN